MKANPPLEVGDKVILHEHWLPCETHMRCRPVRGSLYCVRQVERDEAGKPYVRLVGLRCVPRGQRREVSFSADAFRRIG